MGVWPFKRCKTDAQKKVGVVVDPKHAAEILVHQDANKQAVAEAKDAATKVVKVFERNHFTVKIALAMGAQHGGDK